MKSNPGDELKNLSVAEKRALLKHLLLENINGSAREHPLSFGQRALWFVHKLLPGSAAYNIAFAARLGKPLNVLAFERALARLTERHSALRTVFVERSGEPFQRILRAATVPLRHVEAPSDELLREQVLADYRLPFDLEQALVRVTLFRLASSVESVLLITVHHLVSDAWSVQVLFDDLRRLYSSELGQPGSELAPVSGQYSDFVSWQQGYLTTPQAAAAWVYWSGVLARPCPVLQFPFVPESPNAACAGSSIPFEIDAELTTGLRELGRAHRATLYMVLLAAFQVLLHICSGRDDILVGSPVSGRNQPQWAGVIGYFINMLPIRSDLCGNPTFAEQLARTRQTVLAALEHQELPFPLMVERLHVRRDNPLSPFVQAMFNLVLSSRASETTRLFAGDGDAKGLVFGDTTLHPYSISQQEAQFGLVLEMVEAGGKLVANLKYRTDLLGEKLALTMAGQYRLLLAAAVANPDSPVAALVSAADVAHSPHREQILL